VFGGVFTNSIDKTNNDTSVVDSSPNVQSQTLYEKFVSIFKYGFVEFLQDISKWLIIGLVLAAAISALIPDDFITGLGLSPIMQMAIMLLVSIPLYICATASVPLAAVLMLKGLSPGAALVLLMAGPATNAATITMIGNVLGKKSLFGYLISIISGALIFGIIIDYLLPISWFQILNTSHLGHNHEMMPNWLKMSSGILLTLLIINGYLLKYRSKLKVKNAVIKDNIMGLKVVKVEGMTCNHCKTNVENNLAKLDFIKDVKIDLATGRVELEGDDINLEKVKDIVNGLGYKYVAV
jgi:copper chaperone CopZ